MLKKSRCVHFDSLRHLQQRDEIEERLVKVEPLQPERDADAKPNL